MIYKSKVIIDGIEVEENPEAAEGTPNISDITLRLATAITPLAIGATASDSITFTLLNPWSDTYDGAQVELYVSPQEDTSNSLGDLDDEAEAEDADGAIDESPDALDDDDDTEGEDLTPEEEAEVEEVSAEHIAAAFDQFEGEDVPVVDEDTDEAEEPEWERVGVYFVYSQSGAGDNSISLTAYDAMSKLTDRFEPAHKTATVQTFYNEYVQHVAALYGLEVDPLEFDTLYNREITWPLNTTYREAIEIFAGILGGYASIGADGTLGVTFYAYNDRVILDDDVISYTADSSGEMVLHAIACDRSPTAYRSDLIDAGAGQGVKFTNQFVTQEMLDDILTLYDGIRYEGARAVVNWDTTMQSGQLFRIMSRAEYVNFRALYNALEQSTDPDEITALKEQINAVGRVILASNQTIRLNGAATSTIESICGTEYSKENPVQLPTDAKFRHLYADMIEADRVIAREIEAERGRIDTLTVKDLDGLESINGQRIHNSAILAKALSGDLVETALGVRVYYQATEPTAENVGDIWYVTLTDAPKPEDLEPTTDTIKTWNGSEWITREYDANAIFAANSITAREIVAETITADEINLNSLQTELERVGPMDGNHLELTGDGMTVYKDGFSVAEFGDSITLSPNTLTNYLTIGEDGIRQDTGLSAAHNHTTLNDAHLKIWGNDSPTLMGETYYRNAQINSTDAFTITAPTLTITAPNIVLDGAVNIKQGINNSPLMRTTHTISNISISAGSYKDGSLNITQSGYYPMAIAGWSTGSTHSAPAYINLSNLSSGSATINYRMVETKNTSQPAFTLTVQVLWFKYKAAQ